MSETAATRARVLSVRVGLPRRYGVEGAADPMDRPWTTGFFKEPVTGAVRVGGRATSPIHSPACSSTPTTWPLCC